MHVLYKTTVLPISLLLLLSVLNGACAQEIIDFSKYKPIKLQNPTTTVNYDIKENKMIMYSVSTNSFDTIENVTVLPNESYFPGSNETVGLIDVDEELKNFGGLVPADQIGTLTDYPIRTVVKLYIDMYNPVTMTTQTVTCSGIMVGANYLLTAGHCVDDNLSPSSAIAITVVPAYNMGSSPFGAAQMINWYSFTGWVNFGDWNYDIAMVTLNTPIGNTVGWLGWGYNMDNSFFTNPGNTFHSFGYPAEDDNGVTFNEGGERMYYMAGYMDYWESLNAMCHYNIGYHGQSGSGLYYNDGGNRIVYGVLSHGSSVVAPIRTCHTRLDQGMFNYFSSVVVGVDDLEIQAAITISPNPSNGVFNLNFSDLSDPTGTFTITDNLGRLISTVEINAPTSSITIDLSQYEAGSYFVSALLNDGFYLEKIMLVK